MSASHPAGLTEQDVLLALKGVQDPDLKRDLVDLGMIKDIRITDQLLELTVNLTTPACPLKGKIEADVREAIGRNLGNARQLRVNMTADVRGKGVIEKGDIPGVRNVIAVGSGKGGVGKSTLAASLAYGLQHYGSKVGLMDADVYGPSVPHLVGASGRPMAKGERIQPIEANGLKLMSIGFLVKPEQAVIMRGPMLHGIVNQFLHQVDWGELDYLVIDLPPGTGDVPLTLSQTLPLTGAVVVCTPQEVALLDATRAVAMFRQLKVPLLGMVENMSFLDPPGGGDRMYPFGHGGARRRAEELDVPFLGEVPLVFDIREKGDVGLLHETLAEGSPSRPYLLGVVEALAQQISIRNLKAPKMPTLEIIS
ncbi:Mrp/NBP35 family ATP-binding protein [Tautonia marina]|uniref:Mrp/NBP35 family ATP-binding protein n=1 Tax=Tautonia marina TaxID=2653855 RepID=UPI001260E83A|nr:Mrp/NBP35 family ATP-binding protein [Tautonia marina]